MAMSLQSITELSVYPWEWITGLGPLLNKSNFALPMLVPLFCQGYVAYILCFLEVCFLLFWGYSWFRLDETLPFYTGLFIIIIFVVCPPLDWRYLLCFVCLFAYFLFSFLDLSFSGLSNDTSRFMLRDSYCSLQDPHYFLSFFTFIPILYLLPFPSLHYSNHPHCLIQTSLLYICLPKCALLFYMHVLSNYVGGMISNILPSHSLKNQHCAFKNYPCCYVHI